MNMLLRFGLSVGLQDKEAFVDKVGKLLQEKMGTDALESQKVGEQILTALETVKDQLVIEQLLSGISKSNKNLEQQLKDLSKSIEKLNDNIGK